MNMTNKLADRIMEGARTPEGKVIAILLVLCLAFMCWNVGSLRAFGDAYNQVNASADADKAATAQEQSAEPAPEQPAATEEAPAAVEQPAVEEAPVAVEQPVVEASAQNEEAQAVDQGGSQETAQEATQEATKEEAKEEAKEETQEESTMPAQSFRKVANGVEVRVEAPEGAFPAGTEMVVTPVATTQVTDAVNGAIEGEASDIIAVDITFRFNGVEIEPERNISVSLTAVAIAQAEETEVVHIADNGAAQVVDQVPTAASNEVAFVSDQFSVYAIVVKNDEGEVADEVVRYTYNFQTAEGEPYPFYNNAGQTVYSQIVKDGDVLENVGTPAIPDNAKFQGWYVFDEASGAWGDKVEFGTPIKTGDASATFTVRPFLGNVAYINFYEDGEGAVLLQRKQVVLDNGEGTFDVSTVKAPDDAQKGLAFVGWSTSPNSHELVGEDVDDGNSATTLVKVTAGADGTAEVSLYPVYKSAHWVNFFSAPVGSGATYIPPAYVTVDKATTASARPSTTPQWAGYEFQYWTKTPTFVETGSSEEGAAAYQMVEFATPPAKYNFDEALGDEDITLYGYWQPANANYTVVYWQQNVNDDKTWGDDQKTYEFYAQKNMSGLVGSTVTAQGSTESFTGFTLNRAKSDQSVTVTADGKAVLNLYYDRNLITMVFQYSDASSSWYYEATTSGSGEQYGYVNGQYVKLTSQTSTATVWTYKVSTGWFSSSEYEYTGTRYTRTNKGTNKKPNYEYTPTTSESGTQFGYVNGEYIELTKKSASVTTWYYDGAEYTGQRFVQKSVQGDVYTGLYGSTLASQGERWPGGIWSYTKGSTTSGMSYLGEFVLPDADSQTIVFSEGFSSTTSTIEFYLQRPDGTYDQNEADDAGTVSGGGKFSFTEKYDGFKVAQYRRYAVSGSTRTYYDSAGKAVSDPDSAWATAVVGGTAPLSITSGKSTIYLNLEIRYARKSFTLKFVDSANGSVLGEYPVVYGATLAEYYPSTDPVSTVPGKEFAGLWYSDSTCTRPVFFSEPSAGQQESLTKKMQAPGGVVVNTEMAAKDYDVVTEMPRHDLTVYAGWDDVWYWVKIDPNGGMLSDTEATWFWETYGEAIEEYSDVTRKYVANPAGTYYYHYDEFNAADPEGPQPATRKAYYTDSSVLGSSAATYSFDEDAYALVGWFKVNADGSLSAYNFGAGITDNLTLRAVWRQVGDYRIVYHLEGVDASGKPLEGVTATGQAPIDSNAYADASDAAMASASGLEAPSGYVFWGWFYGDRTYNPGDAISLDAGRYAKGDVFDVYPVFVAVEDVPVATTHIVYDGNGGTTSLDAQGLDTETMMTTSVSDDRTRITDGALHANQSYTLRGEGTFEREGYKLVGWETWDGAYRFALGQGDVAVDNAGVETNPNANTLRALWERDSYEVTVVKAVENSSDALKDNTFRFAPSVKIEGSADFATRENFALADGQSVSFSNVPYGSQFKVVEDSNGANFTTQIAAVDANGATVEPVEGEESTYTIKGNTTITFTNTYDSYTVAYDGNAGSDTVTNLASDSASYKPSDTVTVTNEMPARAGYTFLGWNTEADGSGVERTAGSTFDIQGNTTLYAQWVKNDALVYEPNGGTGEAVSVSGTVGAQVEVVGNLFTRTGYEFAGWNTVAAGSGTAYSVGSQYTLTDDLYDVLYAQWTAKSDTPYAIEYYLQDLGNESNYILQEGKTVKEGTTDTTVSVEQSDIKSFEGFTYNADNGNNVLTGTVAGDGSLVLKVYYDRNSYAVSYAYGNEVPGASALPQTVSYKFGQSVTLAPDAAASGYAFSGWTTSDATLNNRAFTMPAKPVALTGTFTANADTAYKVNHWQQNLEGAEYTLYETESLSGTTGETATATVKEYAGFKHVDGNSLDKLTGTIDGDGSLVLDVYYDRQTFTVTYTDGVEGEDVFANAVFENVRYGAATPVYAEGAAPQRQGYVFGGWDVEIAATVTADAIYNATWTAATNTPYVVKHYKQNVNDDGYTLADTDKLTGVTGAQVEAVSKSYEGFTLNEGAPNAVVSGTVAANGSLELSLYYDRDTFGVTYEFTSAVPDGASALPVDNNAYRYGALAAVAASATAPAGYSFSGWSIASPNGASIVDGVVAMPASNVVLAGSFSANTNTPYRVEHYQQNAGNDGYTLADTDNLTGTTGIQVTAEPKDYSAAGFTHVNVSGKSVELGTIAGDGGLVLKVYYNRTMNTVSYSFEGTVPQGAGVVPGAAAYRHGATVNIAENPTVPAGYTFSGWTTSDATVSANSFTMPRVDVAFTGTFTANSDISYKIERYLQNPDGTYPAQATVTEAVENATTDTEVTISERSFEGYKLDDTVAGTMLSGTVAGDGSLVLRAYYAAEEHTVTYAYSDATPAGATVLPEVQTYLTGATVTVAPNATLAGYDFSGWQMNENGSPVVKAAGSTFVMPAGDVVLTGSFVARTDTPYTVEYYKQNIDNDDYTLDDTMTRELTGETGAIVDADLPTLTGFHHVTVAGKSIESGVVSANDKLVLKVYYDRDVYNVTYAYANAPTTALPAETAALGTAGVRYGATVSVAADGWAPGYTFSGWKTSDVSAESGSFTMPANNVAFTGAFTANTNTAYKVEYYYQVGGSYDVAPIVVNRAGTTDTSVALTSSDTTPTKAGYVLDESAENTMSAPVAGDGTTVLRVYFKQQFTVTYLPGNHAATGSEARVTSSLDYGTATPAGSYQPEAGYTFTGFNPQVDATVTKDATYTAQWAANADTAYNVVFHYQVGGEYADADTVTTKMAGETDTTARIVAEGATPVTTRAGYVYDASQNNVLADTIAGDGSTTLHAYFKQQFTVSYLPGERGTFAAVTYEALDYGSSIPNAPEATGATGYHFTGWNEADGAPATTATESATYVAQWAPNTYNMTFDANGGDGSMEPQELTYDSPQQIDKSTLTREGYVFTGWNTEADGSGTHFDDQQVIENLASENGATIALFAQWTADWSKLSAQGFAVTYDGQPHAVNVSGALDSDTVTFESSASVEDESIATRSRGAVAPQSTYINATPSDHEVNVTITRGDFSKTIKVQAVVSPIVITMTSASATKAYDGLPLENANVTIDGVFAEGEDATVKTVGTQTYVGSSDNEFTYQLENAKAQNYDIRTQFGTLTVTDATNPDDPANPFDPARVVTKTHAVGEYGLGDVVEFSITVKNIYAETKTVTLTEREGVELAADDATFELAAGESRTVTATHRISEQDIAAGTFVNTVDVSFTGGDIPSAGPFAAEDTVTPEAPESRIDVYKTIQNPKDEYSVGDTIEYLIEVHNSGNQTVNDVVVTDQLTGAAGAIEFARLPENAAVNGNTVVLSPLAPGDAVEIWASYTVQAADNDATIANAAFVSGTDLPEGPATEPAIAEVEGLYTLTVNYVYANTQRQAAHEPYVATLHVGQNYDRIASPAIEGFTPSLSAVEAGVMPANDVEVWVEYKAIEAVVHESTDDLPEVIKTITGGDAEKVAETAEPGSPAALLADAALTSGTDAVTPASVTAATVIPAAAAATGDAPVAEIVAGDDGTPMVHTVGGEDNPLTSGMRGSWSLIDLLATLLVVVLCIIMLVGVFGKRREDEDGGDDDGNPNGTDVGFDSEDDSENAEIKRHRTLRLLTLVPAIVAVVLLFLTQDFTQPMVLFDFWTLVFVILALVQVALTYLARKKKDDDNSNNKEEDAELPAEPAAATI